MPKKLISAIISICTIVSFLACWFCLPALADGEQETYTVTYNANGGSFHNASLPPSGKRTVFTSNFQTGNAAIISAAFLIEGIDRINDPLLQMVGVTTLRSDRENFEFSGWATEPGSRNVSYYDGDTYAEDKDITLYAVWKSTVYIPGDLDSDGEVTDRDAIRLLFYTFFPNEYPVTVDADFDKDGEVTDKDAVYLLFYTFFPETYPI